MMQARDWVVGLMGTLLVLFGILPLFGMLLFLNDITPKILVWAVLIFSLILVYCAIVEITNSNVLGWVSFLIAIGGVLLILLPILSSVGVGPSWFSYELPRGIFSVVFVIQGAFLMAATFAMEL